MTSIMVVLVIGLSFGAIRKEFIDPKFALGEWGLMSFQLPSAD